jgi:hypothetical protein
VLRPVAWTAAVWRTLSVPTPAAWKKINRVPKAQGPWVGPTRSAARLEGCRDDAGRRPGCVERRLDMIHSESSPIAADLTAWLRLPDLDDDTAALNRRAALPTAAYSSRLIHGGRHKAAPTTDH